MIGRLRGTVITIENDLLVLDVGGVGYELFCHSRLLASLAEGEVATLIVETNVREDHIHLYGFADDAERKWFRTLAGVQRVGNKVALLILGAMTPQQAAHAIAARDTTALSRLNGIGPKLAERIVTELKDKAIKLPVSGVNPAMTPPTPTGKKAKVEATTPANTSGQALEDTISALTHLGYSRSEAYTAALQVAGELENASLDEMIKRSLKELTG